MEGFLQSTTAHGLSNLVGQTKSRKAYWILGCLGAYILLICAILTLKSNFLDPANLKTVVTMDTMFPDTDENEAIILPPTWPRFVLCAKAH